MKCHHQFRSDQKKAKLVFTKNYSVNVHIVAKASLRKYYNRYKKSPFYTTLLRPSSLLIFNVLKSGTLLSAAPECHSQNRERRRSATPFCQKERCGSGTRIFEESENMSGPLFPLFFLTFSYFFYKHMLSSKFIYSQK